MKETHLGKFLSLVLRHQPEVLGLALDPHGWLSVDLLLTALSEKKQISLSPSDLAELVAQDEKQRFALDGQGNIRANQGHSVAVDVGLVPCQPPPILYHGTGEKYRQGIQSLGLIAKTRLYVHLSQDIETASQVGRRHGDLLLYQVQAQQMDRDGFAFFRAVNGVWLTEKVPLDYLRNLDE